MSCVIGVICAIYIIFWYLYVTSVSEVGFCD
jgi:hypothetical protein